MWSSRFIALAVTALVLGGCMQTGGPGMFGRDAPPPWQQSQLALPPILQPGARPVAVQAVPMQTAPVQPVVAAPMMPQPISPPVIAAMPAPVPMMAAPDETGYALDSGDKLRVVVFGQEGLSASYSVDTGGNITMPLIGAVRARGKSPAELQQSIAARLRDGYVREPHVAVEVELYRPFFVLGEVTLPGQYPYVPNMTAETAVAIAGGYTPRAQKRKLELSRQINGLTERRVVSPNYPVRPGDTVHVAERWF